MTDHPITPPPELAAQWVAEIYGDPAIPLHPITLRLVERAAQWGADQCGEVNEAKLQQARDQELEACIAWFDRHIPGYELVADRLREGRRPKPPSLKEQALIVLDDASLDAVHENILRRALEALPND